MAMLDDDEVSRWPGIDPGKLRNPINIQSYGPASPITYSSGGVVQSWTTQFACMAYLKILRGTDLIKSGQDVTKTWIELTIRYQPGITPQMRVEIPDYDTDPPGTHYYAIQAVEDIEHRRVLLRLTCLGIGDND